jgi:hypothetical protein
MSGASYGIVLSPELAQITSRYTANPSVVVPAEVREEFLDALASVEIVRTGGAAKSKVGRRLLTLKWRLSPRPREPAASRGVSDPQCPASRSAVP